MTQIGYQQQYVGSANYGGQSYLYKIEIIENSQKIENNTTNITVNYKIRPLTTYFSQQTDSTATFLITTNNNEAFNNNADIRKSKTANQINTDFLISSWTGNLTNKDDGSLSIDVSITFGWSSSYASYTPLESTITASANATVIPRATTPTFTTPFNLGSALTINTPRASSLFTHKLEYTFGSLSGVIAENVATSTTWNVPLTLANQIPNSTSGVGNVICKTYNGTQLIGTKSVPFTANVPSSVVPSIDSVTITEAVSGLSAKFGGYVQNKSKLNVQTGASGIYGSTISKYETTIQSVNYLGNNITSNIVTASGAIAVTSKVTDSRGRTKQISNNIEVLAYFSPKINSFSAFRCNEDESENDEGTRLNIALNFAIAPVDNKNDKNYDIVYKPKNSETWATLISGSVYSRNDSFVSSAVFNVDNSYDVQLRIWDYFGSSSNCISAGLDIPTAFTLMDWHSSGKGLSIGKVAEYADLFDINLKTKFRKEIEGLKTINSQSIVGEGNILIEGVTNYSDLENKPKINDVELVGNKTSANLGLASTNHNHTQSQITNLGSSNIDFNNNVGVRGKNTSGTALDLMKVDVSDNLVIGEGIPSTDKETIIKGKRVILQNKYGSTVYLEDMFDTTYAGHLNCSNNSMTLGLSSKLWYRLYCRQSPYVSSDARAKKYVNDLDAKYENLFHNLNPKRFKMRKDGVDDIDWHIGFVAQDVESAIEGAGLDKIGLIEHSFFTDDNGVDQDRYVLAYDEFIALNTHMIKKLYAKIDELEQRIVLLEIEEVVNDN